ncbi:MAG TPA: hypothetical protein VJY62_04375 [Bacteroidia bacterium]|nr:hypothetical protein [Bacteroidia bacterium]
MDKNKIKQLVEDNRIQEALVECAKLDLPAELKNVLGTKKNDYRNYKIDKIDNIKSFSELDRNRRLIVKGMLDLLDEYDIIQTNTLGDEFSELANVLDSKLKNENASVVQENASVIQEVKDISAELKAISSDNKKDLHPTFISRIGEYIKKFQDKDSKEGKALSVVKNGVDIVQNIGKKYNSIAQWFALPQIPNVFL